MKTITVKTLDSYIKQARKMTNTKYKSYGIGNNLWFRVNVANGNAMWQYRIAIKDLTKKSGYLFSYHTIGNYPEITLLMARIEASKLKQQVKSGINPNANKNIDIKLQNVTFQYIYDKWIAASTFKPTTLYDIQLMYNKYLKSLSQINILNVDDKAIWDAIIQPILDRGHAPRAKIVLLRLKQIMRFAYHSHIIKELKLDGSVVDKTYKTNSIRQRVLSDIELKSFLSSMNYLHSNKTIDTPAHHCLLLILLLGTRKTELASAKWEQYNAKDKTILLTNTKNNDDLLIKLPSTAIKLIDELNAIKINEYIFYGINVAQINIRRLTDVLKNVTDHAKIENLTIHDLRRTFSSTLSRLGFKYELIDKATNHKIQGTRKHYQHDDLLEERYNMLQKWDDYLGGLNVTHR